MSMTQWTSTTTGNHNNIIDDNYYAHLDNTDKVNTIINEHGAKWCDIDLQKSNKGLSKEIIF